MKLPTIDFVAIDYNYFSKGATESNYLKKDYNKGSFFVG